MVIAPDNNLIPYPGQHYPVQRYIPEHPVANQQRQQGPAGGQKLFGRPHPEISARAGRVDWSGNLYDFKLFLRYPAFDPVGLRVDIYA